MVLHPSMPLSTGYDAHLDAHVAELGGVTVAVGTAGEIAALYDNWAYWSAAAWLAGSSPVLPFPVAA